MFYAALAALLCAADSLIKYVVERNRQQGEVTPVLQGKLLLKNHHNTGAMLNLGADRQQVVAMISLLFTVFMSGVFLATLGIKGKHMLKTGLALILGGAFSNTYDRLMRKYVVDYVSFGVRNSRFRSIVFNISDFGIMIGSCLLVLAEMKKS